MCGRYVSPDEAAAQRYWELKYSGNPFEPQWGGGSHGRIDYNTVPTRMVMVERTGPKGPELTGMRWGMDRVDWQTGEVEEARLNNARVENVRKIKPFAEPFRTGKRGCQLVMGYYEWKEKTRVGKIPHYIRPTDQGEVFALACVYDHGINNPDILTCSVITMNAHGRLAEIDERMPAILLLKDHDTWLNGTPEEAFACLRPYPDELLEITRVRKLVNSSQANGPALIEPDPDPEPEALSDEQVEAAKLAKAAEKSRREEEKADARRRKEEERAAAKAEKAREREAEQARKAQARRNAEGRQGDLF